MGKGIIKFINEIKDEFLDILYPYKNKCIICNSDFYGICPLCDKSIKRIKNHEDIISYGYYNGTLKKLILEFKYNKNFIAGKIITNYLCELIENSISNIDCIVYVPSSKKALKLRGFNQCEFLAKEVGKKLNIEVIDCIKKRNNIKEQKSLSKEERYNNIINAFFIEDNKKIKNKNILLIDDVTTTGATVLACKNLLKKQQIKSIKILTVAKSYI